MKTLIKSLSFLLVLTSLTMACKKDDDNHVEKVNAEIYKMMKDVYLWNDYLPANADPGAYSTPADFMEALRYDQFDKWSTALTEEEFNQYFEEGVMVGHGFMVALDQQEKFRIAFVYRFTQAADSGVKRGWIISKIKGTTVTTNNFTSLLGENKVGVQNDITFINENEETVTLKLTKEEIDLTPVLHYEILEQGGIKIGYMVFQDFIETANAEIDEVFTSFTANNIDELIIDLRYNGGGSVSVAEHLAGWMIGKDFGNQPFIYYEHNAILDQDLDTMYTVPVKANGLSLDRIFFIGTENTASASELIIKGVEPFVGSVLAGSNTHGKPVGMYAIPIFDYVTLPVCFKYSNKDHQGDFYDGIVPFLPANDDVTRDFGDPDEASLKAILDYIDSGMTSEKSAQTLQYKSQYIDTKTPLSQYLRAF